MPPLNPSKSPSPPTLPASADAINNGAGIRKRQSIASIKRDSRSGSSTAATSAATTAIDDTITPEKLLSIRHGSSILYPTKQLNRLGEVLAGPSRASKFRQTMIVCFVVRLYFFSMENTEMNRSVAASHCRSPSVVLCLEILEVPTYADSVCKLS